MKLFTALGLNIAGLQRRKIYRSALFRLIYRLFMGLGRSFALLLFSCVLIFLSIGPFSNLVRLNTLVVDISAPFIDLVNRPFIMLKNLENFFSSHTHLREKVKSLEIENERLKNWKQVAFQVNQENDALKKIIKLVGEQKNDFITVRVIGKIKDTYNAYLILAGAKNAGLKKNDIVLSSAGLLGRIIKIGMNSSRVLLMTDINSRIPVEVQSTGEQGIVVGTNGDKLLLKHIEHPDKIRTGDELITSGYGGVFPRGLKVGKVIKVEDRIPVVESVVSDDKLQYVLVIGRK